MSFLDFTRIRKEIPGRKVVWNAVERWAKENPGYSVVPVMDLIPHLQGKVDPGELLNAVDELTNHGLARKAFRVIDPAQRIILHDSYASRPEVPEKVLNNWDVWIEVSPRDIAMVLEQP
jgi:hypothetical protein